MKKLLLLISILYSITTNAQMSSSGLVLYYPFNGNANDASGNGNNGVVHGPVLCTDRFGNANSAYHFDGVNDYIKLENPKGLSSLNFTYSFWVKINQLPENYGCNFIMELGSPYSMGPAIAINNNYPSVNQTSGWSVNSSNIEAPRINFQTGLLPETNVWNNIVLVRNDSSVCFYENGILLNEVQTNNALPLYNDLFELFIGTRSQLLSDFYFNGSMDDIRIYNKALDSVEISNLFYSNSCIETLYDTIHIYDTVHVAIYDTISVTDTLIIDITSPFPDLILYFPFDGNANDESGNKNNGTVYGAILTTDRFGNENSAYSFDGINDYITVKSSLSLQSPTNQVTISAWVYPKDYSYRYSIVDKRINVSSYPFSSYVLCSSRDTNKTWQFSCSPAPIVDGKTLVSNSTSIIRYNNWYHIVGVYDSTIMKIYVNGDLEDIDSISGQIEYSDLPLYIGTAANVNGHYMNGTIDDIRIYKRALDAYEISKLYNDGATNFNSPEETITVKVFPNPAKDKIYIQIGEKYTLLANYSIKIINTNGQEIFKSNINQNLYEVNIKSFGPKGLYFIQVFDNSNHLIDVKKIILQ
jgi:hypothetical protein